MALIYQPSKRIFCGWFEPLKSTTYSEYPESAPKGRRSDLVHYPPSAASISSVQRGVAGNGREEPSAQLEADPVRFEAVITAHPEVKGLIIVADGEGP